MTTRINADSRSSTRQIGPWTVGGLIYEGWPSKVFECRGSGGQAAVMKLLVWPDREGHRRFRDEVETLRDLADVSGVLPLIDGDVPEQPTKKNPAYFVMPLATPIQQALQDAELEEVVDALATVAGTLSALAERRIFHRDIKPANLYRYLDRWVVGDFELVDYPGNHDSTEEVTRLASRWFSAPETDDLKKVGDPEKADVYALGKTLWILASGPFFPLPVADAVEHDSLRHPRAYLLDRLIEETTQFDPARRPTMGDFHRELQRWAT